MTSLLSRSGSKSTLGSKEAKCTIRLLDDVESVSVEFKKHDTGQYLLDYVCDYLQLVERDYFGIRLMDSNQHRYWLDLKKPVRRQVKVISKNNDLVFSFRVKFYPYDPSVIKEEITRYQLFLQLKRDLLHGRLYCPQNDAAYLGACILQDELGQYNPAQHQDGYVSEYKLLLRQTAKLEEKISVIHRSFGNMLPAEAELKFLKKAVEVETYGFDPYSVKDSKFGAAFLGLTFRGLLVYQSSRKLYHLHWDDIEKLDYVGRDFAVYSKLLRSGVDETVNPRKLIFVCPSGAYSKHLWKYALEQKVFFTVNRSSEVKPQKAHRRIQSLFRGSTFRYNGRVYEEIKDREVPLRAAPSFKRAHVERQTTRSERTIPGSLSKFSTMPSRLPPFGLHETGNGYSNGSPLIGNVEKSNTLDHHGNIQRHSGGPRGISSSPGSDSMNPLGRSPLLASPSNQRAVYHAGSYHSEMGADGPFDTGPGSSISDSNATSPNISPVKSIHGQSHLTSNLTTNVHNKNDISDGRMGGFPEPPSTDSTPLEKDLDETIETAVRALEKESRRTSDGGDTIKDEQMDAEIWTSTATTPTLLVTNAELNGTLKDDADVKRFGIATSSANSTTLTSKIDADNSKSGQNGTKSVVTSELNSTSGSSVGLCRRLIAMMLTVILAAGLLVGLVVVVMECPSPRLRRAVDQFPAVDIFRHRFYSPGRVFVLNAYDSVVSAATSRFTDGRNNEDPLE